jgi:hypothetical protein
VWSHWLILTIFIGAGFGGIVRHGWIVWTLTFDFAPQSRHKATLDCEGEKLSSGCLKKKPLCMYELHAVCDDGSGQA